MLGQLKGTLQTGKTQKLFFPKGFSDFEVLTIWGGPKRLSGVLLGTTTIELALANLLCFFDWELLASIEREDIDIDIMPSITTHKKNSLYLIAK
ncbi:Cytochrome P450 71B35, partial [Bienertia sinuspersici]